MADKSKISIVGAGNVGFALAYAFANLGHAVSLISRNKQDAQERLSEALSAKSLDQPASLSLHEYPEKFEGQHFILLTVPDGKIKSTCEAIADGLSGDEVVLHCSGALDSSLLVSAKAKGCPIASAHPLNTFPNLSAALNALDPDHGTYLYCEGDISATDRIKPLFEDAGFRTADIDASSKTLYHAACVFACNYLTVLMDMSLETAKAADLDPEDFWQACQPIIKATLLNLDRHTTADALSGPVARGDMETVERHLQELHDKAPELAATYQAFTDYAIAMLKRP